MSDPRHAALVEIVRKLPSDFEPWGVRSREDDYLGDCSSGCNVGGVEYCQKFYPEAIDLVQLKPSPKPAVWMNAGCRPVPDAVDGNREFACCAAMP